MFALNESLEPWSVCIEGGYCLISSNIFFLIPLHCSYRCLWKNDSTRQFMSVGLQANTDPHNVVQLGDIEVFTLSRGLHHDEEGFSFT